MSDEKGFEEKKKRAIQAIIIIAFVFIIIVVISITLDETQTQPDFKNPICGNGFVDISEDCDDKIGGEGCPPNYGCKYCKCTRLDKISDGISNGIDDGKDDGVIGGGNGNIDDENVSEDGNAMGGGGRPDDGTTGGGEDIAPPQACTISSELVGTICEAENCIGEMIGECCAGVCVSPNAGFTECFNTCVQQGLFSQAECEVLCSPS
ncbi:MAG: hypothetical protein ABID38_05105 [Candidatus Diapherotrites archaeon]